MSEDQANDTRPRQPLSFGFKVAIGFIACAGLYTVFGSNPPTSQPSQPIKEGNVSVQEQVRSGGKYVVRGTRVHMTAAAPACAKLDDLSKFRELATENDKAAVTRMVYRGDCQILDEGSVVVVQESSVWRGAECVRVAGDTDCLWTITKLTDGHLD